MDDEWAKETTLHSLESHRHWLDDEATQKQQIMMWMAQCKAAVSQFLTHVQWTLQCCTVVIDIL